MNTNMRANRGERPHDASDAHVLTPSLESIMTLPSGEPLTWGPTPLNPLYDKVLRQQADVQDALYRLATEHIPLETPPHIADYVASTFLSRFHGRGMANYDNYMYALSMEQLERSTDPMVQDIYDRSMRAHANPAELLYVRQTGQMGSVELGCVTIPYGKHIEHLESMRLAVNEAVALFGGTSLSGEKYSIKSFDVNVHNEHNHVSLGDALVMTRKRDIARLPDGTRIRERSSFVVRTDEQSHFDQDLSRAMHAVPIRGNDSWKEDVCRAGRLETVVPPYLASNDFLTAIPLSATMYAYNPETEQKIRDAHHMTPHFEWHEDASSYPEINRLRELSRTALGGSDDILYVGPRFSS